MLTTNALCLYCTSCKVLTDATSANAMQEKAMPTTFSENLNKLSSHYCFTGNHMLVAGLVNV